MLKLHFKRSWLLPAVLLSCLIPAGSAVAQDSRNLLEDTKRLLELKAQKVEADVNDSIAEADRLAKSDPSRAAQQLRKTLVNLSDDLSLTARKRDALLQAVRERIEKFETEPTRKPAEKPPEVKTRPKGEEVRRSDESLQRDMDTIRALRSAGRTAEADRRLSELARGNPDNPAIMAAARIAGIKGAVAEGKSIEKERAENFTRVGNDLERTASIPVNDVNFPSDWKDRAGKRTAGPKMSAKEKAIMEALRTTTTIGPDELKKQPFEDVLKWLSKKMNVPVSVDKNILEAAGIAADTPITIEANQVTYRTILRKVLAEVNLTYIIKNETIQIMTPEAAANEMSIRSYSIADLIGFTNIGGGGLLTALQMSQNIQSLMSVITSTVEPQSWEINGQGGKGTISFFAPTMSLVVKQTSELHMVMGSGLK
jgi:hypothetical protein